MPKIQSTNIASLCAQLGFDGNLASREPKILTEAVKDFRLDFVQKGNDLVFSRSDTPEARHFALSFCHHNNLGDKYWPLTEDHLWPCWQTEQEKILTSLAHIFALQAFYEYQGAGKARRRSNKSAQRSTSISSDVYSEREISPESKIYIGPAPPKGTKRRPAKTGDPTVSEDSEEMAPVAAENLTLLDEPDDAQKAAEQEIAAVDPRKDSKPIKEFTKEWLYNKNALWPEAADTRLRFLMHENDTYSNSNEQENKMFALVNGLREGTELTGEVVYYKLWSGKVRNRVKVMASRLLEQKLLQKVESVDAPENAEPIFERTEIFRHYWRNRHTHWKPKVQTPKKQLSNARDTNNIQNIERFLERKDESTKSPVPFALAKAPTTVSRVTQKNTENRMAATSRIRKEPPGEASSSENEPVLKRQKPTTPDTDWDTSILTPISIPPKRNASISRASVDTSNKVIPNSPVRVQEPTPTRQKLASPAPLADRRPSVSSLASPTNIRATSEVSTSIPTAATPTKSNNAPPPLPPKDHLTPQRSPSVHPRQLPLKRLIFILPQSLKPDDPDLLDPVPFDVIREMDHLQFFNFVAERAHATLEELPCLTFTLVFTAGEQMEVVTAGDEQAWSRLRQKVNFLFKTLRSKPWHRGVVDFEVGVDIGDLTGGVEAIDVDD